MEPTSIVGIAVLVVGILFFSLAVIQPENFVVYEILKGALVIEPCIFTFGAHKVSFVLGKILARAMCVEKQNRRYYIMGYSTLMIVMGMSAWPQIGYAAGLSGLLHGGVAVLAVHLLMGLVRIPKGRRWGSLLLLALVAKLTMESGWSQPVVWDGGTELSVVQALHLTSALWGAALALLLPTVWRHLGVLRRRRRVPAKPPSQVVEPR